MNMRDRLFSQTWRATAPLLVWTAHFALCYGLTAAECSPALARQQPSMAVLWLATALALAACAWMLWRARAVLDGGAGLVQLAQAGSAVLALAGIGWTAVPLLLLGGCG
jgi:hypothetical protein